MPGFIEKLFPKAAPKNETVPNQPLTKEQKIAKYGTDNEDDIRAMVEESVRKGQYK